MSNRYLYRYTLNMDAAALIKEARARAGFTQSQLAHAAGTSQPTLAAYESGAKSPSVRTLDRLVRAAGVTLDVSLGSAPAARGELLADLRVHAREIRVAAQTRLIRNVRVFGSAARGEESAASDVDLLVDFDAERHGLLPLIGFASDVRAIMGRPVDATTVQLLRDEVRQEALKEAVPL